MPLFVPFAIDPASLGELTSEEHKRFLNTWREHGVLVDGAMIVDQSDLSTAINRLPPTPKKIWKTALGTRSHRRHKKVDCVEIPWPRQVSVPALHQLGTSIAHSGGVIALSQGWSEAVDDANSSKSDDVEFTITQNFDQTRSLNNAKGLNGSDVSQGTDIEEVWETYFKQLALSSKTVEVVDLYALTNLLEAQPYSGLDNLLYYLDRDGRGVNLTLYTGAPDSKQSYQENITGLDVYKDKLIPSCIERWANVLTKQGIKSFEIRLIKRRVYNATMHERWIRFDGSICTMGRGLGLIEGGPGAGSPNGSSRYAGRISLSHPRDVLEKSNALNDNLYVSIYAIG